MCRLIIILFLIVVSLAHQHIDSLVYFLPIKRPATLPAAAPATPPAIAAPLLAIILAPFIELPIPPD